MTSQAQAMRPLPGVRGLAFLGFPLHPPDKTSIVRSEHLSNVEIPMLFIQGTRDKLAQPWLLHSAIEGLGKLETVHPIDQADHGFHVPARSGRNDRRVVVEMLDVLTEWASRLATSR